MLAFKCDVCGKLFEEEKRYNTLKIYRRQAKYLVTDREMEEREYDVCPVCMNSIVSLIQVLSPENHIKNKERSE